MSNLTKDDIRSVIEIIKGLYLEDMIPWICGYSGGKDSTAVVQLVWNALSEIPPEQRKKTVHVICTDTLVESPVVALWASESLRKMGYYRCSECNHGYQRYERGVRKSEVPYINGQKYELHRIDNFCPNCGAKMAEGD